MCYVRNSINYSDSKYSEFNVTCKDLEMQWILLSIPNVRPIVVVNIYRPPQGDYKKCCKLILDAFEKASMKGNTDIFVMGDFNINADDVRAANTSELFFTMGLLGLRQVIDKPTRISTRNDSVTKSRIDLIFTNSDFVKAARVLDSNLSDHMAVMVTRKKVSSKSEKIEFRGRSYRNYIREDFQRAVAEGNWDDFFAEGDPNTLWDMLEGRISGAIDQMCPIKTFKMKQVGEPWLTR